MRIGNVDIKTNVALGPMAGVTDLPFRLLCTSNEVLIIPLPLVSVRNSPL